MGREVCFCLEAGGWGGGEKREERRWKVTSGVEEMCHNGPGRVEANAGFLIR